MPNFICPAHTSKCYEGVACPQGKVYEPTSYCFPSENEDHCPKCEEIKDE